jgi:hypothetical protein
MRFGPKNTAQMRAAAEEKLPDLLWVIYAAPPACSP